LEGKKIKSIIVTGMDIFAKLIRNESDNDFIESNSGRGKLLSFGLKCTYI
jgi:hypothetical protein